MDVQHLQMWNASICLNYTTKIFPTNFPTSPSRSQAKGRICLPEKKQLLNCKIHSLSHTHMHKITREQFLFMGKRKKHPLVHTCWCYTLNPQLPCLPAKDQEFLLNFHSLSLLWNCALALPLCQCEANLHLTSHRSAKTRKRLKKVETHWISQEEQHNNFCSLLLLQRHRVSIRNLLSLKTKKNPKQNQIHSKNQSPCSL